MTRLDAWPTPPVLAAIIHGAGAAIAHSFHLTVSGLTGGIPVWRLRPPKATKYEALARYRDVHVYDEADDDLGPRILAGLGAADAPATDVAENASQVTTHWDRVAEALRSEVDPATVRRRIRDFAMRVPFDLDAVGTELADTERTLGRELEVTSRRLESTQAARERETDKLRTELRQTHERRMEQERRANRAERELEHAQRTAERWKREFDKLKARKIVRIGLGAAEKVKPAVQAGKKLARKAGLADKLGAATEAARTREKHVPATAEEAAAFQQQLEQSLQSNERTDGPLVSILVLTRNGRHHLERMLPALAASTYRAFEVVVVDNGSDDGSVELLRSYDGGFPLKLVENRENASFSVGNNQALAEAAGELVLLLNNDIYPATPGWLGRMVDTLEERDAAAVGARLIYPRRPDLDNAGDEVHPDLTLQHRGVHFDGGVDGVARGRNLGAGEDALSAEAAAVREIPAVTAACMLVRTATMEAVGGLTEGYLYGTEDVDLCLKIREHGGTIVYDGQAVLWHHEFGTQNAEGRERKRANRLHNRELFVDLWGPRIHREVMLDRLRGEQRWSFEPLHVAITVTKDDPEAGWGDYYTAHEFGDALLELGYRVSYVERYDDRWYDLDATIDVLVVLIDAFELWRVPRHLTTVAWIRNWTDRWIDRPWFDDYDLVLASSETTKRLVEERSSKAAHLFPLATNPDRFHPRAPDPALVSEALFTGNYWDRHRDIIDAIGAIPRGMDLRVHGSNWEKVTEVAPFDHGPLDYHRLPDAYASTKVVIDDTAHHAKPYGAVNSRVFDALATGALVISDNEVGVRELFGDDLPVWTDGASLRSHLERVHEDPEGTARLAARLRDRVLAEHTYARRAEQLRDVLLGWCEARRVGIAIGVPKREVVDEWGDYHFARDLQRQLELAGHPTRVNLLPEWTEAHTGRDDVVLHLFGLSQLTPRRSQVTVLWNISHPELVTPEMVAGYDLAFVASDPFARELADAVDVPVRPLHQATDADRFAPGGDAPHHELLFVANSRKVKRRIVADLTPTRHDLAIYGTNWTSDLVDPRYVKGDHVPNRDLPAYYANADIVLNDHWDDMREHGFLSNRLYDALAAGAFVVSDHVEGVDAQFDGAVVTYRDRDDLAAKVDRYLADPEARRGLAEKGQRIVRERHTFAHRVRELLEVVEPAVADRPERVTRPA